MRHLLPVLILFAGLGSSFSLPLTASPKDPFSRYLAKLKESGAEPSLERFAKECGLDVSTVQPRFAVGPGSSFSQVQSLSKGLRSIDTDFYSTAEVWMAEDRTLVEVWANSDDVGSEVRYYKCFDSRKLIRAEVVEWHVPVAQASHVVVWGYSRRWERNGSGRLQRTKVEFVDGFEHPIPKPRLDAEDEKNLSWSPPLGPLSELMLPPSLLK